jgi:hypothetical protein
MSRVSQCVFCMSREICRHKPCIAALHHLVSYQDFSFRTDIVAVRSHCRLLFRTLCCCYCAFAATCDFARSFECQSYHAHFAPSLRSLAHMLRSLDHVLVFAAAADLVCSTICCSQRSARSDDWCTPCSRCSLCYATCSCSLLTLPCRWFAHLLICCHSLCQRKGLK